VELIILGALLVAGVALWLSARAAVAVCVLEVRAGTLRVVRGGIAGPILSDIQDVIARAQIDHATLRIVRSGGYARLEVIGAVPDAQRQQLRNVVGSVPLARLVNARRR
jgi:hypothetical protein